MPQLQVVDLSPTRNPDKERYREMGSDIGASLAKWGEKRNEDDAVQRLVSKYQPGMDRNSYLRETMMESGIPLEKRAKIFDALTGIDKEEQQQKNENASLDDLEKQTGLSKKILKTMPPAVRSSYLLNKQKNDLLGQRALVKDQDKKDKENDKKNKNATISEAANKLLTNPNFSTMPDQEFAKSAHDSGIPLNSPDYKRLVDIRNDSREYNQLTAKQLTDRWAPLVDKIRDDAKAAKARQTSFSEAEKLISTGKVGPKNFRNFVASYLPNGPLKNMIETPENQATRTLAYYSIIGTRNDFSARGLTNLDVGIVLDKIIGAEKTPEANRLIMKLYTMEDKLAILKEEVSRDLRRDSPLTGMDFDVELEDEVQKRIKEQGLDTEYERTARDIMSLNEKGEKEDEVWMIDPNNDERYSIPKNLVEEHITAGARRL